MVTCLFIFLMVSFDVQKMLILTIARLTTGLCVALVSCLRNLFQNSNSERFSPVVSPGSFMTPGLTARSVIHLEFIFIHGMW